MTHPIVVGDPAVAEGGRLERTAEDRAQIWPSVGEYPVYDEFLDHCMTFDDVRNRRYEAALRELVYGRTAVDFGTGPGAGRARACVEAGARHVYVIEPMHEAVERTRETVERSGMSDRITVLHGQPTDVRLPERVDVCISEIVGAIGGAEGCAEILGRARRRLLKPGGAMIPHRCRTRLAAVTLPDDMHRRPGFSPFTFEYVREVFQAVGHPFDVRLCIANADPAWMLSGEGTFEDLELNGMLRSDQAREGELEIEHSGRMDGFLLWIELQCAPTHPPIDSLRDRTNWLPVFFPVFYPGVRVQPGDRIRYVARTRLSDDGIHPDYLLEGRVFGRDLELPFAHASRHHGPEFRRTAFHAALFPSKGRPERLMSGRSPTSH